LQSHEVLEIKHAETYKQISAGAFHVLAVTEEGKVFGWGDNKKCQLASRPGKSSVKFSGKPVAIPQTEPVQMVKCGSLFSMALV